MIINDYIRDTLAKHCIGFVTSINCNMRPEMARIFGYAFDEGSEILSVFVYKEGSTKLLSCLDHTKKMAVVLTDLLSFMTIQLKGDYLSHADSTPEEETLIKNAFREKMKEVITIFGFPEDSADNWKNIPSLTIKIQCKEIYDQAPKINTGVKIS